MKTLAEIRRFLKGPEYVGEILDGEIKAVAGVDRPATGRRWRFFKGLPPRLAPGLADYTACLERGEQSTPTECEAGGGEPDDPFNRSEVLRADMAGHSASIADAKMLREVEEAIDRGELGRKGEFEDCVESVMSKPDYKPAEGRSPEEGARAICATKPGGPAAGGKGADMRAKCAKDEAADVEKDMAPPPPPDDLEPPAEEERETIEIPATPTEWSLAECLTQAQEMGLPEDAAVAACQMVRGEFGDPSDENKILVPEGTETEGLINAAAMHLGAGKALKSPAPPAFKFKGQNHWQRLINRFLGRPEPRPGAKLVDYLKGLEARVEGLKMEMRTEAAKSREDLRLVIDQQGDIIRALAGLAGVTLPERALAATPAAEPAPAADVAPANPLYAAEPAKGAKDGAAAGAPVAPTEADRLARLEAAFEALLAQLQLQTSELPDGEEEDELEAVGAAPAPAPAAVPKRASVALPPAGVTRLRFGAKAAEAAPEGQVQSSILSIPISAAERAAARNGSGLPRFARR